jgi:rhodanese-related sulfurtransferase
MRRQIISELRRQPLWRYTCLTVAASLLLGARLPGHAQELVIQSLAGNGVLTWSNGVVGRVARVEWAPSLGETWSASWNRLTDIAITNPVMARPVPMFYRVVSYPLPEPLVTNLPAATGFALLNNRFAETNFIVLDARTPSEYAGGHVKTALNVSYFSAAFQQTLMKLDRKAAYLLYCGSGSRSAAARDVMRTLDFMEVYNLTQGYSALAAQPGASAYVE